MPPDLEPRTPGGAHPGTGDRRPRNGNEEKGCEEDHKEEGREEVTRFQDNSGRSWKGPVATPALFLSKRGARRVSSRAHTTRIAPWLRSMRRMPSCAATSTLRVSR